jgi:DNA-binding transcriptional LysR family regulator
MNSISASAALNHVSQSAVSQGIRKLEATLQKSLITHRRKTFKLTREGEILFESCKSIFKLVDELQAKLNQSEGELSGNLLFACSHSLTLSLLPRPLSTLTATYPLVKPSFRLANTTTVMHLLKQGIIEFGIVLDNSDLSGFEQRRLEKGSFKLFYSDKFKMPQQGVHREFLLTEEQKEIFLLRDAFKARYHQEIITQMEISSWEVIATFIEQGIGIGFIPDFLVRYQEGKKHFKEYEIDLPHFPYSIYAIYPKREKLSRNAEYFLGLFQE